MLDGNLPNVRPNTKYEKTQKPPCLPPLLGKAPSASQAPSLGLEGQQQRGEERGCFVSSPQLFFLLVTLPTNHFLIT